MKRLSLFVLLAFVFAAPIAPAQRLSADGGPQTLDFYAEQFFSDIYFHFSPNEWNRPPACTSTTPSLRITPPPTFSAKSRPCHAIQQKVEAIPADALDAPLAGDREMLLGNIRSMLLSLEVIRPWEKNPDNYSSGITQSAFVLMSRKFAPANTRLRAVVAREQLMPQVLQEAR